MTSIIHNNSGFGQEPSLAFNLYSAEQIAAQIAKNGMGPTVVTTAVEGAATGATRGAWWAGATLGIGLVTWAWWKSRGNDDDSAQHQHPQSISIGTHGRSFDAQFMADFNEAGLIIAEAASLKAQINHYELIGLTGLIPILQEKLDGVQLQLFSVAAGYGVPAVTGALDMVASADGSKNAIPSDIAARLKSDDIYEQWRAWKDLYSRNPTLALQITQADLGRPNPSYPGLQGTSTRIRIPGAIGAPYELFKLIDSLRPTIIPATIDVASLHPAETVSDYVSDPYAEFRHPIMATYLEILKQVIEKSGSSDPELIMRRFFERGWAGTNNETRIEVIQFPSGYRVLFNGHHRVAALMQATRIGIIPAEWLKKVPVMMTILPQDFPIPEVLFLQIFAPAHQLSMDELLPPVTSPAHQP